MSVCRVVAAVPQAAEPSAALLDPELADPAEAVALALSVGVLDELDEPEEGSDDPLDSDLPAGTDADEPLRESVR